MSWCDDKFEDLLDRPETAYVELPDAEFKAEQDLAEKYRSFVTEMLRLSLAGVAVFSFIYKSDHGSSGARPFAAAGVIAFAVSIGCSLWFLFRASEGLRYYIAGLRYSKDKSKGPEAAAKGSKEMLKRRGEIVQGCRRSKCSAAAFLMAGAGFMAIATALTLVEP